MWVTTPIIWHKKWPPGVQKWVRGVRGSKNHEIRKWPKIDIPRKQWFHENLFYPDNSSKSVFKNWCFFSVENGFERFLGTWFQTQKWCVETPLYITSRHDIPDGSDRFWVKICQNHDFGSKMGLKWCLVIRAYIII